MQDLAQFCHWTQTEADELQSINTYAQLHQRAIKKLLRLPQPVVQVCGPLSTGGRGNFAANMQVMNQAVELLVKQGKTIFDQRPFETPMRRILLAKNLPGYDYDLLNEFYLPLFETGRIKEFHFIPGWQGSTGARWEHNQAKRLGIAIFYFAEKIFF